MRAKLFLAILFIALLLSFSVMSTAEMASENYRIRSSVHSAGGIPTGSANYQLNGTIGQPSPVMDPLEPPLSDTYDLYPGFWYTLMGPKCECDLNGDGSCNGLDWLLFYPDWGRSDCNEPETEPCECDLNEDGSCDGKDWLRFYPHWGRTDCPLP